MKKCIDCSGLLWAVFNQNGAILPHSSLDQARFGKVISEIESLLEGDLVFFHSTYETPKLITHSGIYLGDGTFIHTSSKQGVVITSLSSDYWSSHYLFATRVFE